MHPKSEKIAEKLIAAINQGKYTSNMPSEQELAKLYKTTAVTASKALNILRDRGIVRRIPRLGTFVNHESKDPLRIYINLPTELKEELQNALKHKFPQLSIEFCSDSGINPLKEGFDIIRTAATFPYSFSKYLKPLPDDLVQEYCRNVNYFQDLINISCDHHVYYSLPVLFSPIVLAYNKNIAEKLNLKLNAYDFSFESFMDLIEKVEKSPYKFSTNEPFIWIRYILFRGLKTESSLSLSDLEEILRQRIPLILKFINTLPEGEDTKFSSGKVLFKTLCRQQIAVSGEKFGFDWDILPLPALEKAKTVATGEFLTVLNSSKRQDDAFKVVKAFLDTDIQQIFTRHKFGLPVNKSLIADTLDSRKYRDDIFINEINHMETDNAAKHELHTACLPLVNDFCEQKISAQDLCESIVKVFLEIAAAAKRREKAELAYNFVDM